MFYFYLISLSQHENSSENQFNTTELYSTVEFKIEFLNKYLHILYFTFHCE